MAPQVVREEDFPAGHPARFDYNPNSPEAKEWRRCNVFEKGEPAYGPNHPYTLHPELNQIQWQPGIDPFHPEREAFTGREPPPVSPPDSDAGGVPTLSALDTRAQGA